VTPVYQLENAVESAGDYAEALRWIYRVEPVLGGLLLLLLFPLVLFVGAVIAAISRRSPLVRHTRVGWRGAALPMLKFRTMWDRTPRDGRLRLIDDIAGPPSAAKCGGDPRVTSRFAAICRRYSIDEIPQLYHVARGQMSFVGPRPITREELELHYGPHSAEVLRLKPGMTGLWQVLGRNRLTYHRRKQLDLLYVRRASPELYLRILLRTVPRVVGGYDAY
jgi:exopolysaccharide production protein ExoY